MGSGLKRRSIYAFCYHAMGFSRRKSVRSWCREILETEGEETRLSCPTGSYRLRGEGDEAVVFGFDKEGRLRSVLPFFSHGAKWRLRSLGEKHCAPLERTLLCVSEEKSSHPFPVTLVQSDSLVCFDRFTATLVAFALSSSVRERKKRGKGTIRVHDGRAEVSGLVTNVRQMRSTLSGSGFFSVAEIETESGTLPVAMKARKGTFVSATCLILGNVAIEENRELFKGSDETLIRMLISDVDRPYRRDCFIV